MAEKILGPTGSKRRSRFRFLPLALIVVAAIALLTTGSALAVHDQTFQLDGNTAVDSPTQIGGVNTQSLDWDSFFDTAGAKLALPANYTDSAFVRDFRTNPGCSLTDPGTTYCTADSSTFATGSKDTLDITPGWQCTYSNNVNSKTDLSNVYAVSYTTPVAQSDGKKHQILYFGLERNDNSGDGNIGFWFLQDSVGCNASVSGVNVPFTGNHKDGDILVVSAFTNGGTVSGIDAYRWNDPDGAGPAVGSLGTTPIAHSVDCRSQTLSAGDKECAASNTASITTKWKTANKNDGVGNTSRTSEFFEGGLDLTLSGLAGKCFSSFLGDTRSSQSLTATIFDFAAGSFQHCGANISISPNGVNGVGSPHPFTVHITAQNAGVSSPAADGTKATVTLKDQNGATITASSDTCATTGTVNGDCTVTVNSSTAVTITAHATASVVIQGSTFNVATDGKNGNSGDAVKRYVDANVTITPNGVNEVNHAHEFTVSTTGIPSGTTATLLSITPHVNPSTTLLSNTCASSATWGGSGLTRTCTFQINSSAAATFEATADVSWKFDDPDANAQPATVTLNRSTDGTHGSSGSVTKKFVDASIAVAPSGVNEVTKTHTFAITVTPQAEGTTVGSVSITPDLSPAVVAPQTTSNTCGTPTAELNGTYTCTVTVNSPTAATFTLNASTTLTFTGTGTPSSATVTRSTAANSGPNGTGPATKRFVDAAISIAPDDTNGITEPHTFTVTVTKNLGAGAGFVPAAGEHVDFTLTDGGGAAHTAPTGTCTNAGANTDASGQCTITFASATAGTVVGTAKVTIDFGGNATAVTRDTDPATADIGHGPGGSGPATKTYVAGTIVWHKVDHHSQPLGGATFEVCRTDRLDSSTDPDSFIAETPPVCVTVPDDTDGTTAAGDVDQDPAPGEFKLTGLILGMYTITETVPPAGYAKDNTVGHVTLDLSNLPASASGDGGTFVNVRLFRMIVITCSETGPSLVTSTVTLTGQTPAARDTISGVPLNLAAQGVTEAELCDIGAGSNANYGMLDGGTYNPSVLIPKP